MTADQKLYRLACWIATLIIAGVLLAGYHKILYPEDFALAVYRFQQLPGGLVNLTAIYISWLEVVCAVCLLFVPRLRAAALWIVLALLIVFTGSLVINLIRGTAFSCGCFSNAPDAEPMNWRSVARNLLLVMLAGLALYGRKKSTG